MGKPNLPYHVQNPNLKPNTDYDVDVKQFLKGAGQTVAGAVGQFAFLGVMTGSGAADKAAV